MNKELNCSYRYLVTQPTLNAHGTLHGGNLMKWVDEACGMQARLLTGSVCATRNISEIDFLSSAKLGDIIQIDVSMVRLGTTSITFSANVINAHTHVVIATFKKVVFVGLGEYGAEALFLTGVDYDE